MRAHRLVIATACLWVLCNVRNAETRTLAERLDTLISENSFFFKGSNLDSLTPAIERLAILGTDLPPTSTVPGVQYVFDVDLGVPTRVPGSLRPVFLETGQTVGVHRLLVGASYLYADLDSLDGRSATSALFFRNSASNLVGEGIRSENHLTFREFGLVVNEASFNATYGVTDRWDVNVLVPILDTRLDVRALSQNIDRQGGAVVSRMPPVSIALHEDAVGIGDVLLRTKYRLPPLLSSFDDALGLTLRLPTGEERNFQGRGDWIVQPSLILSRAIGQQDVHANLGYEFNGDDFQRGQMRYGIGVTLQRSEAVAALVYVIGSSGIADETFSQTGIAPPGARFDGPFQRGTAVAGSDGSVTFHSTIPRTDIVDLSLGFKFALFPRATGFLTANVPLSTDGLRADVIPGAGFEYTF